MHLVRRSSTHKQVRRDRVHKYLSITLCDAFAALGAKCRDKR